MLRGTKELGCGFVYSLEVASKLQGEDTCFKGRAYYADDDASVLGLAAGDDDPGDGGVFGLEVCEYVVTESVGLDFTERHLTGVLYEA